MEYVINPSGVCARAMKVEIEDDIIKKVTVSGGCPGNSLGLAKLLEGMHIEDAVQRLKGVKCGFKDTSCPDQLAIGLENIIMEANNEKK